MRQAGHGEIEPHPETFFRKAAIMREPVLKANERHNASADEEVIDRGACGQKHLATGRACIRLMGHSASCDFRPPSEVRAVATGEAQPRQV